jgi:hypothetical protein
MVRVDLEGILVGGQGDAGRAGRVRIVWVRRREEERRDDEWLWTVKVRSWGDANRWSG